MKLVFSSDWHGDVITQGVDRYDEVEEGVMESVKHAIAINADVYFFGGDLCDPHTARAHRSVMLAHRVAYVLDAAGIPSYWLVGNHDVIEDGSGGHTLMSLGWSPGAVMPDPQWSLGWSPGAVMSDPQWFTVGTHRDFINVVALPFTPTSRSYDPVEFIEGLEIDNDSPILVIGHLNLKGICAGSETLDMPRGREVFWPTDAIKAKFPRAIMVGGHYHERQTYDGVRIIGSTARLTYGEGHHKVGYLELEI